MEIAVITGASSGIGREFAKRLDESRELDELWVISRSKNRLSQLALHVKTPIRVIDTDLAEIGGAEKYQALLDRHSPNVRVLVNSAGFGKFGRYDDIPIKDTLGMVDLNCRALVEMTAITLPYMREGGRVFNMASLSSYQPVPYLNIYAASKAFVLSYSRALGVELKPRGVRVIAVTPGWVRTAFFERAGQTSRTAVTYFNKIYLPAQVAEKAIQDIEKGKDISILGLRIRMQVLLVKLLPHRLVMRVWMHQQKHMQG